MVDTAPRRPPPRTLSVLAKRYVTPHMLRVKLGGPGLDGFPEDSDGGYVKLHLENPDNADSTLVRTYTVRHYRASARELDIDFVIHDSDGPAASWALACEPDDKIKVGGPGPKKPVDPNADWFVLVGDMSALPAISANIERMEPDAKGYVLLEVLDAADRQHVDTPEGLQVQWIVNREPEQTNSILFDAVKALRWLPGTPYAWVAGELNQSLEIRRYLKSERDVGRVQMYASSYWQIGQTEDGHRVSKRQINEKDD